MATPRSYADPGVNERRLRPIYDCLDNNNNKKALQEAEKLLKKQRDFSCAKVLKALALIRLGREQDGSRVLREVHAEGHTEDSTLQAMTICYREIHKPELIADAYEIAVRKEPQNEELFSHLFMAYVRLLDYKKQQQTAMTLYKLKPKNPYYFWAVMSLVMQACDGNTELAAKIHLPLAQKMVEKFINENKVDAEAEIQLYLMILEKQEKYEECLNVLDGPQLDKLSQYLDILARRKAELLMLLKRWSEANSLYKQLLRADPDNWSYYLQYFESLSYLVEEGWTPDDNASCGECGADFTYPLACIFMGEMLEKQAKAEEERRVMRGPSLAQMELLNRLNCRTDTQQRASELGSKVDLMVDYFVKYGSRMICYTDMAHLISSHKWSQEDIHQFLDKAKQSLGDSEALPENIAEMQRHLCLCQLQYNLGQFNQLGKDDKLELIKALLRRYSRGQEFGRNFLTTDFHPNDDYALIAASLLIDLWQQHGEESLLLQVVILLEQGISSSPSNFHMKLLLIKLYNSIGAVGPSHLLFETLDIKHIQQETMGYLTSNDLISDGHFSTANTLLGSTIWFYQGNLKDTVEYLIACYKFGSFTKVQEMVNFRERLNNSLYYASVMLDRIVLSLMLESKNCESPDFSNIFLEIDPKKEEVVWKNLQDSKDVSIFRIWSDAKKGVIEDIKVQTFKEEICWCKLWSLVLRCASAAHRLSSGLSNQPCCSPTSNNNNNNNNHIHHHHSALANGEESPPHEILSRLTKSLREHVASIDTKTLHNSIFPLQAPDPLRLKGFLEGGYPAILLSSLDLIIHVYNLTQGAKDSNYDSQFKTGIIDNFQAALQRIDNLLQCQLITLTQMREILQESVTFVQAVSLTSVLFNIIRNILKPVKNASKKNKKRKEAEVSIRPDLLRHFEEMLLEVNKVIVKFIEKLSILESSFLEIRLRGLLLADFEYCLKDGIDAKGFFGKIEQSYNQSIKEITELAQNKIKFLQGLKL